MTRPAREWSVHFPDREPLTLACCPPVTFEHVLRRYGRIGRSAAHPSRGSARCTARRIKLSRAARAIRGWLRETIEGSAQSSHGRPADDRPAAAAIVVRGHWPARVHPCRVAHS
jgi:hypothetical protein